MTQMGPLPVSSRKGTRSRKRKTSAFSFPERPAAYLSFPKVYLQCLSFNLLLHAPPPGPRGEQVAE